MKNTRNPSKPPPTALTASPPSILSASLHSPNLPVHTPRAKAHSWKEEDTQVLVLPVQDNPTLIPASNSLTAQIQHTPSAPQQKQKHLLTHHTAPPHPGKAGQLALLPSGTRRENKWKALNRDSGGLGFPTTDTMQHSPQNIQWLPDPLSSSWTPCTFCRKQLHHPTTPTGDKGTAGSLPPLDRLHQDLGKKNCCRKP